MHRIDAGTANQQAFDDAILDQDFDDWQADDGFEEVDLEADFSEADDDDDDFGDIAHDSHFLMRELDFAAEFDSL